MAGIGDLNFDPAQNYYGQDGQRPRFVNSGNRVGLDVDAGANGMPSPHTPNPNLAEDNPENIRVRAALNRARTSSFAQRTGIAQAPPPLGTSPGGPTSPNGVGAGVADAAGAADVAAQSDGIGARIGDAVGAKFSPTTRAVGRVVGRTALGIGGTLVRNAGPIGDVAYEGMQAAPTLLDPRATGYDKAAAVSKGIGRGLSTLAGAGIGAAAGSVVPLVGTAIGGIAGGIAGYYGGNKAIQWGRRMLDTQPYEAPSFIDQAVANGRAARAASGESLQPVSVTAQRMGEQAAPAAAQPPQATSSSIYKNPDGSFTNIPGKNQTAWQPGSKPVTSSSSGSTGDSGWSRALVNGAWVDIPPATAGWGGKASDAGNASSAASGGGGFAMSGNNGNSASPGIGDGITAMQHYTAAANMREQSDNEDRARQQQQIGSSLAVAQDYDRRQAAENRARIGNFDVETAQWRGDGRDQINKMRTDVAADQREASTSLPSSPTGPNPEQEVAIGAAKQRQRQDFDASNRAGDLQQQQGIAQGIELGQKQQLQTVFQRLNDPATPSAQRRQLQEQALIMQGKDPRADTFQRVSTVTGTDQMGQPIKSDALFDTENRQWMTPPGVGQAQQQPQNVAAEGEVVYQGGKAYKRVGDHMVPLTAANESKSQ